jgi:hypothetical protein
VENVGAAGDTDAEEWIEGCDISGLRSNDERIEETLALGGTDWLAMRAGEPPVSTGDKSAGRSPHLMREAPRSTGTGSGTPREGRRRLARWLFQEGAYREPERFPLLRRKRRVGSGVDRLNTLQSDGGFVARPSGFRFGSLPSTR